MSTAPPARAKSAQLTAYDWLKEHISRLPRSEGTFLSETEIAAATGTSRTPVREALLRLETEGFVQIIPKRGIYVPAIGDDEVANVMQARLMIEDWCIRRAVDPAGSFESNAGLADELDLLIDRQAELASDPIAFIEADRAFHRAIVRRAGNPVVAGIYETLRERQVRMGLAAIANSIDRTRVVLQEHRTIVQAVRSGDPEVAATELESHLSSTLRTLNLLTRG